MLVELLLVRCDGFAEHLLYTILSGRPLIVRASPSRRAYAETVVRLLALWLPSAAARARVLRWRECELVDRPARPAHMRCTRHHHDHGVGPGDQFSLLTSPTGAAKQPHVHRRPHWDAPLKEHSVFASWLAHAQYQMPGVHSDHQPQPHTQQQRRTVPPFRLPSPTEPWDTPIEPCDCTCIWEHITAQPSVINPDGTGAIVSSPRSARVAASGAAGRVTSDGTRGRAHSGTASDHARQRLADDQRPNPAAVSNGFVYSDSSPRATTPKVLPQPRARAANNPVTAAAAAAGSSYPPAPGVITNSSVSSAIPVQAHAPLRLSHVSAHRLMGVCAHTPVLSGVGEAVSILNLDSDPHTFTGPRYSPAATQSQPSPGSDGADRNGTSASARSLFAVFAGSDSIPSEADAEHRRARSGSSDDGSEEAVGMLDRIVNTATPLEVIGDVDQSC